MKVFVSISRKKIVRILNVIIVLLLASLFCIANPSVARADTPPNRTPTFSTTHGTATAQELVAAMDVPSDMIISASLGTSDPTGANVFAGDGTFTGFQEPTIVWIAAAEGNYGEGRGGTIIDSIVIHYIAGSFQSGIDTFKTLRSPPVSAHYLISGTGTIVQMVKDEDTAYHATYYNRRSIGIELEGSGGAAQ